MAARTALAFAAARLAAGSLLTWGLASRAPASDPTPPVATDDLVDLSEIAPGIRVDMRYATADNFLHKAVYPCARCLLRRSAAEALGRAQRALATQGLGLRVWDCYRPPSVQREMWALVPDPRYVADPRKGSIHGRGGAVDVTLVDAAGESLPMPTAFDDFTPAAAASAPADPAPARNRAILRAALEREGFSAIRTEWWHFDAAGSRGWPLLDVPICDPAPPRGTRR